MHSEQLGYESCRNSGVSQLEWEVGGLFNTTILPSKFALKCGQSVHSRAPYPCDTHEFVDELTVSDQDNADR